MEWIDAEALSDNPEIDSRNRFAQKNASYDPSVIVKKYAYLTIAETKTFLNSALEELGIELKGTGIELGAGVGGISNSLLSLYPAVDKIYAIEIVPDIVRLLQAQVTKHENNEHRLIPVIGSFDEMQLQDASVDFVVEFDSLHHSNDLDKTLREAARVLKPGGMIVAFDRMHSDAMTDAQREYMLNVEYGEPFKREYGIPLESRLTRRQNGEHEIRESEWRAAFEQAGLKLEQCVTLHRKCLRGLVVGVVSWIPFTLRAKHPRLQPRVSRLPFTFFLFYALPFVPSLWKKRYRPLNVPASNRAILSKTAFVAYKPVTGYRVRHWTRGFLVPPPSN